MLRIVTGDLLDAKEDIIGHQVNCFGTAGGLACAIFNRYPDADNDYMQLIDRMRGPALLGMCQLTGQQPDGKIIANLFGQYYPGADFQPAALYNALEMLGNLAKMEKKSVALPFHISCGIAGGDWDVVSRIIEETMDGVELTLYQREEA